MYNVIENIVKYFSRRLTPQIEAPNHTYGDQILRGSEDITPQEIFERRVINKNLKDIVQPELKEPILYI